MQATWKRTQVLPQSPQKRRRPCTHLDPCAHLDPGTVGPTSDVWPTGLEHKVFVLCGPPRWWWCVATAIGSHGGNLPTRTSNNINIPSNKSVPLSELTKENKNTHSPFYRFFPRSVFQGLHLHFQQQTTSTRKKHLVWIHNSTLKYNMLLISLTRGSTFVKYICVVIALVSKKGRDFSEY